MLGTTVGLYAIPWCKNAILLTTVMSIIGFAMGILDTGKKKNLLHIIYFFLPSCCDHSMGLCCLPL